MKKLEKTEVTTVKTKHNVNENVRNAINPKKYDEYREEWKQATNLNLVTDFPLQIDFELNYSCNFTCPMCTWNDESTEGKGKQTWFDFEVFKEVMDDGVSKGLKSIRLNYINEPLIRKDITKFISYARKAGILDIYFSTNGSLLSDDMIRNLINSGLLRLQVSLDAITKNTYEKIRTGGDYDQVIKKVLRFLEIRNELNVKLPTLRVNFVKTDVNKDELDDFVKFWEDKADSIGIQDLVGIMDGFGKKTNQQVEETKLTGDFRCAQPFQRVTLRYNGTILPCCTFYAAEMPIGQLKSEIDTKFSDVENIGLLDKTIKSKLIIGTIQEIWKSKQMEFIRDIHKKGEFWKHPICKTCVLSTAHFDATQ
ncbi:MAG: radical SAM protein [Thaumarchaeota archaeon]|jgi:molybdenum cofactor biosynthesis enzyme MoaA|nr:MAG: radical SAM protein [Nitrososphaerota archaeon]